jgi:lipopolysaccharide export system protein LptC
VSKKTLIYTILLLAVIASGTYLTFNAAKKVTSIHINAAENPDFFMTNAVYVDLDANGEIHNQINTSKITHFTTDNTYYFDAPHLQMYSSNEQPWDISAIKGKSEHGKEKIYLWENVNLHQLAGKNNAEILVNTTKLTIYTDRKFAETDQPLTISQAGTTVTSIGAQADFLHGTIKLLSRVKGQYQPEKKN